jgi:O-antigen/teichoic acid export membrane protein
MMALYTPDRARRSLFHTVTFRAMSQVATVLGYVVLVRGLSKHDFGVFSLLYAFIPLISTVASLGLEQTLRRFQPEFLKLGQHAAAAWLVRVVAAARLGMNAVVLTIILLGWSFAAPLFKLTAYRPEFALFSVLVLLHFQVNILQLTLASHMLHRFSVGSTSVLSGGKLVAYLALLSFNSLTLRNVILADTVAYALAYVCMKVAHLRYCSLPAGTAAFRPTAPERRRLLRYAFYNNFNDAGTLILSSQSDNFFIAAFLDPVAVGAYSFYVRLNDMASQLIPTRLFDNVVQPLFFAIPQNKVATRMPRDFSALLNANLLVYWPIFSFAVAYHAQIVTVIFGGKFIEYSWLLALIAGFGMINVIANPVSLVAEYQERPGIILLSKVFAIYNVVALLALLPLAGLYGAAFASGSAQTLKNLFIWWHVRSRAIWLNARAALLSGALLWGGAMALCSVLNAVLDVPALVQLIIGAMILAVTALIYLRTPAISLSDRALLASVLGPKPARLLRVFGLQMPASKQ